MLLRDHPLIRYRGVHMWSPVWTRTDGWANRCPNGEIGILRKVMSSTILPGCFLYIDHKGSSYIGCLLFDDHAFCSQIVNLLQGYCNHPIAEIGSLVLSYTL
jgi:hypothetical protein